MEFSLHSRSLRVVMGCLLILGLWLLTAVLLPAQQPAAGVQSQTSAPGRTPAAPPPPLPTQDLGPPIDALRGVLSGLNPARWKIPAAARVEAQSDVQSMQRDIVGTLPSLLRSAAAAPASVGPAMAVYQNVGALYDVLVSVAEKAYLGAPEDEMRNLDMSRHQLEASRQRLGSALVEAGNQADAQARQQAAALEQARRDLQQAQGQLAACPPPPAAPAKKRKQSAMAGISSSRTRGKGLPQ
jgi:hypothetical protein